jgi:hypothetical protein
MKPNISVTYTYFHSSKNVTVLIAILFQYVAIYISFIFLGNKNVKIKPILQF